MDGGSSSDRRCAAPRSPAIGRRRIGPVSRAEGLGSEERVGIFDIRGGRYRAGAPARRREPLRVLSRRVEADPVNSTGCGRPGSPLRGRRGRGESAAKRTFHPLRDRPEVPAAPTRTRRRGAPSRFRRERDPARQPPPPGWSAPGRSRPGVEPGASVRRRGRFGPGSGAGRRRSRRPGGARPAVAARPEAAGGVVVIIGHKA